MPPRSHDRARTATAGPCAGCGEMFMVRPARRGQRHCSSGCAAKRGPENNRYNGGLSRTPEGRWLICCRDGRSVLYARAVMAAHLGREWLRSDEIVHHKNEDWTDDRIENLEIVTRAQHIDMHRAQLQAGKVIR